MLIVAVLAASGSIAVAARDEAPGDQPPGAAGAHGAAGAAGAADAHDAHGDDWITHHVNDGQKLDLLELLGIPHELPRSLGITKHTVFVLLAALLTFLILWTASRTIDRVPRGMRLSIEELVRFFRADFIYPNMGVERGRLFTPFLMTLFLFILIMNLLGMVPFGAAATSNVYVTGALAAIVFACMLVGGMWKQGPIKFWLNLVPHGVPIAVWPMLFLIELMGLIIKPFALMVRLAANMTAGHIVIFSLMSFIFLFGDMLGNAAWALAPFPAAVIVLFSLLELLVAFIQAYVFTMLTAVFVGMSFDPHH
jgi:F-type H+-transporting ATPase subunit a